MADLDNDFVSRGVVTVYALVDPRDNNMKYIGQSLRPYQRLNYHMSSNDQQGRDKTLWIEELKKLSMRPVIKILEEVSDKETAIARETYWIEQLRLQGTKLFNVYTGSALRVSVSLSRKALEALIKIERCSLYEGLSRPRLCSDFINAALIDRATEI